MSHAARFAFAAMARAQKTRVPCAAASAAAAADMSDEDEDYAPPSSAASAASRSSSQLKRKRREEEEDTAAATDATVQSVPVCSLPCLSDLELRAPAGFVPKAKFVLTLRDECRDRGSAKLAIVHVQLQLPEHAARINFSSSFKIDGRKSFSNAPFKRYYTRAIHAAWLATPTSAPTPTMPLPNATEDTLQSGRVLLLLTQRGGRPGGKAFTGMLHESSRDQSSSKHPLLCLASNSAEYELTVLVNQEQLEGEEDSDEEDERDWSAAAVTVSARFDAGDVTLESMALPGGSLAPVAKQARTAQLTHVSSMRTMAAPLSPAASSSPAMSRASSASSAAAASSQATESDVFDEEELPSSSSILDSPLPSSPADSDDADEADASTPLHSSDLSGGDSSTEGGLEHDFDQQPTFAFNFDEPRQSNEHGEAPAMLSSPTVRSALPAHLHIKPHLLSPFTLDTAAWSPPANRSCSPVASATASSIGGLSIPIPGPLIAARFTSETACNPFFGEASAAAAASTALKSPIASPRLLSWQARGVTGAIGSAARDLEQLPSVFVQPPPLMLHALSLGTSGAVWPLVAGELQQRAASPLVAAAAATLQPHMAF